MFSQSHSIDFEGLYRWWLWCSLCLYCIYGWFSEYEHLNFGKSRLNLKYVSLEFKCFYESIPLSQFRVCGAGILHCITCCLIKTFFSLMLSKFGRFKLWRLVSGQKVSHLIWNFCQYFADVLMTCGLQWLNSKMSFDFPTLIHCRQH